MKVDKTTKKDLFVLVLISIVFTLPIFIFRITNDDLLTHISRLYNLGEEFKVGNFNPNMYIFCYGNYGYPFGIFYPDTFFKPFSFLYILGINEYTCMGIMLFSINFLTLIIPYSLLKKEKIERSLLVSVIYFLYPYRLFDYFKRFAIGELMFFVFLPLIVYGVYKIFKEKKMNLYLFIGMYGIIHSHILSILFTLLGLTCYYIFNFKQLDKKVLKYTGINAIFTILTSLDVVFPIFEMQFTESLRYNTNVAFMGTLVENSIHILPFNNNFIGISLILFFTVLYIITKNKTNTIRQIVLLGFILFLTTNLFCWDLIIKIFPFFNIIQFPYRLLVFAAIPWTVILFNISKKINSNIIVMIIALCEIILIFFLGNFAYQKYDKTKMNDVGAGDYINAEIKVDDNLKNIKKDAKPTNRHIVNNNDLGMFYYKNYSLMDSAGKKYKYKNKDGYIYTEDIPDGTELTIKYNDTTIQKVSYITSWFSLIGILIFLFLRRKRCKNLEY